MMPSRERRPACGTGRRGGLSLVEVLVSLTIAVSLLTAAATAFNASSQLVQSNDEFFRATQAARISLHQVLTQVRRGSVNTAWNAHTLRLITAPTDGGGGEEDLSYTYVPSTRKLMLATNDIATDPDYPLASNIDGMTFDVEMGEDYT